jgi:hypothetical protein
MFALEGATTLVSALLPAASALASPVLAAMTRALTDI